jgi:hypothetical protein
MALRVSYEDAPAASQPSTCKGHQGAAVCLRAILLVFFLFGRSLERMLLGGALPVDELDLVHWASPCTKEDGDP